MADNESDALVVTGVQNKLGLAPRGHQSALEEKTITASHWYAYSKIRRSSRLFTRTLTTEQKYTLALFMFAPARLLAIATAFIPL